MKKIIILFTVLIFPGLIFAQTLINKRDNNTVLESAYDLSAAADTSFVWYTLNPWDAWSITVTWESLTGSGTLYLETSEDNSVWTPYTDYTAITLGGASDSCINFNDWFFVHKYGRWRLDNGTISAGTAVINIRKKY